MPAEGIVIAHSDCLPVFLTPRSRRFIVEIKPDRDMRCVFANFIIVQNRHDPIAGLARRFPISTAFMNQWPQPGLIPRDPRRRERFENVGFMGNLEQFSSDVGRLEAGIRRLGLNWIMTPRHRWHDYTFLDAIVSLRPPYRKGAKPCLSPDRKPATKLYNAWAAGVPAVLSPDSAFQDIRRSRLDYLEARSVPEAIARLKKLMRAPGLREAMANNGRRRFPEFSAERTARAWVRLMRDRIIPEYRRWTMSPAKRKRFILNRLAYAERQ